MTTLQQLDMNILLWIQEHLRVDALTPFWRAVTFLGNGGWFWIVLCVLLICFGKTRKTGVTAALSLLSQNVPAPVTTYALFRDGKFVTQSIQSDKKFLKLAGAAD